MSRLIDADELGRAAMGLGEDVVCDGCTCEFLNLIDAQPTIEAEPVRHALWLWYKSGNFNCSACDYEIFSDRDRTPYCPHCGCVMERVGE